jgi:hypothetical protein
VVSPKDPAKILEIVQGLTPGFSKSFSPWNRHPIVDATGSTVPDGSTRRFSILGPRSEGQWDVTAVGHAKAFVTRPGSAKTAPPS